LVRNRSKLFYKKEKFASMRKGITFEKFEKEIENNTIFYRSIY